MPGNHHSLRGPAESLTEVALIDAAACAAVGSMSLSWWHEEVRAGRAPQPAIRRPRCTRWRLADVRAFWLAFADGGDTLVAGRHPFPSTERAV